MLEIITLFGGGLLGFAFLVAFYFIFFKPGSYKIDILEERQGKGVTVLINNGWATMVKRGDKVEAVKINGTKMPLFKPIEKKYMLSIFRKKNDKVYLFRDQDGFLHPIEFDFDEKAREVVMKPHYRDTMDWIIQDEEERSKIKEKIANWQQYTPVIGFIIGFMVFFITVFFSFQYLGNQINKADGMLSEARIDYADFKSTLASNQQLIEAGTLNKAVAIINAYNNNQYVISNNLTVQTVPISGSGQSVGS